MKYVSIVYILSDSIPGQSDDHTYLSDEHTEHTVRVWVRSTQTHGAIMLSLFYFILFYFILFYFILFYFILFVRVTRGQISGLTLQTGSHCRTPT
jgi:hypothetical protein